MLYSHKISVTQNLVDFGARCAHVAYEERRRWTVKGDLGNPFALDRFERRFVGDGETHEEDIGERVGERPESVLLTTCTVRHAVTAAAGLRA